MNWLFVHPPRTGGTSIRTQIGWGLTPPGMKHAHYSYVRKVRDLSDCYVFATVRDPYDRAIGLWHMWSRNKLPFAEWLGILADTWPSWVKNPPHDQWQFAMDGIRYHHAAPQMDWLGAVANFNKLIRFEQREADIAAVSQAIGVEIDPKVHRMTRGDPAIHSEHTREMTRKIYGQDFRALGYPC